MVVCKYFGMYGRCSHHSRVTYAGGFVSFLDTGCPYVSQPATPRSGRRSVKIMNHVKGKRYDNRTSGTDGLPQS